MDKRKFWGSILGTTMFLVMLLGLTYAYYTWRSTDTSLTFSISDAYFKCQSGIETHTTSLEPVNDYKLGSYQTFAVNNVGMTDTTFSLTMDITSIDEELIAEDVKYKLVVDETGGNNNCTTIDCTLVGEGSFANAKVGMNTLVATIFIPNNVNYEYYLFIYIDGEMAENTNKAGKSINGILEVCEIVVFLDYQGGNPTQSFLKVTDTYADLPTNVTKNNFTIAYEENGGVSVSDGTITYTFEGWYTELNGGGDLIIPTTEVSKTTNHTLYAKWSNTCVSLPATSRNGYTFNGWYSDSSLTKRVGGEGDNYCEATDKLYAGWTANQYTVTFDPNDGTLVPGNIGSSKTVTYNSTYGELPSSTREGHVFGGWNTKADGTGTTIDSTSKVTTASNHTLYANWNVVNYTLTLYDGQEQIDEYQVASNANFQLPRFSTIPNVTNNSDWGDFIGWSTDENGTMITYEDASSLGYLTGNLELYAVFGRDIIFKYGENASLTYTSSTKQLWNPNNETGTSVQSPSIPNIFICEDGTTSGCDKFTAISTWFSTGFRDDTTPGSAEYEMNTSISPDIGNSRVLYAVYLRHLYFHSGIPESISTLEPITQFLHTYNNKTSTISGLSMATIPGWQNLGYRDDTTPASYEYSCAYASNFTCKPEYNSNDYFYGVYSRTLTVAYNGNGNTGGSTPADHTSTIYLNTNSTNTSSQAFNLSTNTFTKTDYTFVAWAEGSINGTQYTASSSYDPNLAYNSDNFEVTMYAIWEEIPKVITYYNGSTKLGTSTCKSGENITLKTFEELEGTVTNSTYGWSFGHWTDSQDSYEQKNTDGQTISCPSNDISVYAVYKKTLTFHSGEPQKNIISNRTQYWNPYGMTRGTHLSYVAAPMPENIENWTAVGYVGHNSPSGAGASLGELSPSVTASNSWYCFYKRTLTFYSGINKATTDGTKDQFLNSAGAISDIVSPTPESITNWTTLGYRTDTVAGAQLCDPSVICSLSYESGNTLYAVYTRGLTVSYDGNGNTGGTAPPNTIKPIYLNTNSTTTSDQTVTLALNSYTKIGHTFTSWSSGTSNYNENATYNPNLDYTASFAITMSANWTPGRYTITLSPQLETSNSNYSAYICESYGGGIYLGCNTTTSYLMTSTSNPITIPIASNGDIFKGYYTEANGGVQLIDSSGYITSNFISTLFTEDATLYAQWESPSYNITYYNGSTNLDVSTCKRGENITLKTFEELGGTVTNSTYGWSFGHWANGENTYAQTYTDGQTISCPSNDISLYSVYSRVITFKSGVSASTTSTATQYWNPYGTTALTHLSAVKAPVLDAITNWTALGYRRDNATGKATYAVTTTPRDIAPSPALTVTFNAVYERTLTFYSGVNGETTDGTRTQYLNVNNNTLSSITTFTPASITNWTTLGYRTDTVAGAQSCDQAVICSLPYDSGNALYAVYKRTLTFYSGANASTIDSTQVQYLNSYDNTVSSVMTHDLFNYEINGERTEWVFIGYRTDTIPGPATDSCFPSTYDCAPPYSSGNDLYAVYAGVIRISYAGNGNTGGTIPPHKDETIFLNATSTTTSSQEVTLESNTFTKENQTFVAWAEGSPTGTQYGAESTYNLNIPYDSDSFNVTMYAVWRDNFVNFNFDVNGGYLDVASLIYPGTSNLNEYKVGEDGLVYLRVDEEFYGVEWGKNFDGVPYNANAFDMYDYNDGVYRFSIANHGIQAQSGAEWICKSGCTVPNRTFNQANNYLPSDFCDTTEGDCTVVLAVNWNKLVSATISSTQRQLWTSPGYMEFGEGTESWNISYIPEAGDVIAYEYGSTEFSTIYNDLYIQGSWISIGTTVYVEKNDNNELIVARTHESYGWQKVWVKAVDVVSAALSQYNINSRTINGETYYAIYYGYYNGNGLTDIGDVE